MAENAAVIAKDLVIAYLTGPVATTNAPSVRGEERRACRRVDRAATLKKVNDSIIKQSQRSLPPRSR